MRKCTAPFHAYIGGVTGWGRDVASKFGNNRLKRAKTLKTMLVFFYAITLR